MVQDIGKVDMDMHSDQGQGGRILTMFILLWVMSLASIALHSGTGFMLSVFLMTLAAVIVWAREEDRMFLAMIMLLAFALRVCLAYLLQLMTYKEGFSFISGDDGLYSLKALKIAQIWQGLPHSDVSDMGGEYYGKNPFTYLLAVFYGAFGGDYFGSKLINCYVGAVTPLIVYSLTRRIFSAGSARIACVLVSFYPSTVRWSLCNLKDPAVILMVVFFVYSILNLEKTKKWYFKPVHFMAAVFILFLLDYTQKLTFYAMIGVLGLYISYRFLALLGNKKILAIMAALAVAAIAVNLNAGNVRRYVLKEVKTVVQRNMGLSMSDSAGYTIYDQNILREISDNSLSFSNLSRMYVRGLSYFFLTPFPWNITSMNQALACPQIVFWYIILALSIPGIIHGLKVSREITVFIIIYIFAGLSLWSISEGNIGAAFRHRDYFSLLIFIFSAWTIQYLYERYRTAGRAAP
jgi:hypothetical protein